MAENLYKNGFTGLTDKHGNRIYNGDTLLFNVFDGVADFSGEFTVYFAEGAFRANKFHILHDYIKNGEVEVRNSPRDI